MIKWTAARGALVVGLAATLFGSVAAGSALADVGDGPTCNAAFSPAMQGADSFQIGFSAACQAVAGRIDVSYGVAVVDDNGVVQNIGGSNETQATGVSFIQPPDAVGSRADACWLTDSTVAMVLGTMQIHAVYPDGSEYLTDWIEGPQTPISC